MNIAIRIADAYGVTGNLTDDPQKVLRGLVVWLITRQVKVFVLEFYNSKGQLCRRWDLPINYIKDEEADDEVRVEFEDVWAVLERDTLKDISHYNIFCICPEGWVRVPGWIEGKLADVSKLEKRSASDGVIRSKHISVEAFYYTDEGNPGAR